MRLSFNLTRLAAVLMSVGILMVAGLATAQEKSTSINEEGPRYSAELKEPIRLQADGQAIDIGEKSSAAHAGPCVADVDNDGDRDLLVGDFPGYFWYFENIGTDKNPKYESRGKLQAGNEDAKTPIY